MSLINRKAVKQFILDTAKEQGKTDFTRVGASSFDYIEAVMKKTLQDEVAAHPLVGKTLNLGERIQGDSDEPVKAPEA